VKKHTTSINEKARHLLDISRDEYALCDYIQFRLADPRGKSGGWCCDAKQEIADFVGISRPGLYKMMDRMEREKLIEVEPTTGFARVTGRWIDSVSECKQSLQDGVNKVYSERKQSLQPSVNKVTLNKEIDIKVDKVDIKVEADKPQPTPKNDFPENEIQGESTLNENPKKPNSFTGGAAKNSDAGQISEVVNFLNETVKPACNFRQSSKTTAGHIRQRVAEGFSVSDICIVIEHKTSQWRNDPKMSEYLRPATLFGTGKFEAYLVAARTWEKSGKKSATNSGGYQNQSRSVTTDFGADKDKFQQPQIF